MSSFTIRTNFVKRESNYRYMAQALVSTWKIQRYPSLDTLVVYVNGVEVRPSKTTDTHFYFEWKKLRDKWADLIGITHNECNLMALEDALETALFSAFEHYTETPLADIRGCVFTPQLHIFFKPTYKRNKPVLTEIEMEETCVLSDVRREQLRQEQQEKQAEQSKEATVNN
jgi:hypothetical protein